MCTDQSSADLPARTATAPLFPLVYVIVLNWQGWRDTISCLDSLRRLSYPIYRLLVVDNGSTDGSVARIRAAHPEVPVVETGKNLGFAGGCNAGIRVALGEGAEYVWLLNNDALADPRSLSALVAAAASDPRVGAAGSVISQLSRTEPEIWGGGWVRLWIGKTRHARGPSDPLTYLSGGSLLIRAEALRRCGLLDEIFFMYWEDTDLSFRLVAAGWTLAVVPSSRIWHQENSSTRKLPYLRVQYYHQARVRFLWKHARWPLAAILLGLLDMSARDLVRRRWRSLLSAWRGAASGFWGGPPRPSR
jgi:GT2 family glycosyltransferase